MKTTSITKILFLLCSCLLMGCSGSKKPTDLDVSNLTYISAKNVTDLDVYTKHPEIDSCSYVKLETNENCLLDEILNIVVADDKFFLHVGSGVFVFDKTGKFLNRIGTKGNGPNEYIGISAMAVDEQAKCVVLNDQTKLRLMKHHYDGSFIESIPYAMRSSLSSSIYRMHYLPDNKLLCAYSIQDITNPGLTVGARDMTELEEIFKHQISWGGFCDYYRTPFTPCKDNILFLKPFCDSIFSYRISDGHLSVPYLITKLKTVPEGFLRKGQDYVELDKQLYGDRSRPSLFFGGILSTNRYLLIHYPEKGAILWDRVTNKGTYSDPAINYVNDIWPWWNMYTSTNQAFIGYVNASYILSPSEKVLSTSPKFKQLQRITKEEDNGALLIYHMKQ